MHRAGLNFPPFKIDVSYILFYFNDQYHKVRWFIKYNRKKKRLAPWKAVARKKNNTTTHRWCLYRIQEKASVGLAAARLIKKLPPNRSKPKPKKWTTHSTLRIKGIGGEREPLSPSRPTNMVSLHWLGAAASPQEDKHLERARASYQREVSAGGPPRQRL